MDMSLHHNTKNKHGTRTDGHSALIPFPGVTPTEASHSNKRRSLAATLKNAHPGVNLSAVYDMLYECIYGHSPAVMRLMLRVPEGGSLKRALRAYSPIKYHFLACASETLRIGIENLIEREGTVSLAQINKQVSDVAMAFASYADKVDAYVNPPVMYDEGDDTEF